MPGHVIEVEKIIDWLNKGTITTLDLTQSRCEIIHKDLPEKRSFISTKTSGSFILTNGKERFELNLLKCRNKGFSIKVNEEFVKSGSPFRTILPFSLPAKKIQKLPHLEFLEQEPSRISHIRSYIPKSDWGKADPVDVDFSKDILRVKNFNQGCIHDFANILDNKIEGGVSLTIVPSHDPQHTDSGIRRIAKMLATHKNRIDATMVFRRIKKIQKL